MLDSEELVGALCRPGSPWLEVDVREQVDSTNTQAARDARPWRLVVAGEQTGGHGRQGRSWSSPPGTSVSMSMVVPTGDRPQDVGWVPLVTGLAVVRALGEVTGRPQAFGLKWPNDVLADTPPSTPEHGASAGVVARGKVCGILCQVPRPGIVIVGVGVNVSAPPGSLPVASAPAQARRAPGQPAAPTTSASAGRVPVLRPVSLRECVAPGTDPPTREAVITAIARHFAAAHADLLAGGAALARLRTDYAAACVTTGRDVEVHLPGDVCVVGRAESVDARGRLVVREAVTGAQKHYAAGDVFHIRPRNEA